jgi:hypothetical protein
MDQATGLRRLFAGSQTFRAVGVLGPDARRNAHACAELALGLSRCGKQVLVLDEGRAPYNVGGLWGLMPRHTLADIPGHGVAAAVLEAGPGLHLLAAPEGMHALAALNERALLDLTEHWGEAPDCMLLCGPGGTQAGKGLATTAALRLLVLPGDKHWLADTYATLKSAHAAWSGGAWMVLVEGTDGERAQPLYSALRETAQRFLGVEPGYLGCLPKPRHNGSSTAGTQGALLAETLLAWQAEPPLDFEQYWQRMWLFSRMTLDSTGGKRGNAHRRPG